MSLASQLNERTNLDGLPAKIFNTIVSRLGKPGRDKKPVMRKWKSQTIVLSDPALGSLASPSRITLGAGYLSQAFDLTDSGSSL